MSDGDCWPWGLVTTEWPEWLLSIGPCSTIHWPLSPVSPGLSNHHRPRLTGPPRRDSGQGGGGRTQDSPTLSDLDLITNHIMF